MRKFVLSAVAVALLAVGGVANAAVELGPLHTGENFLTGSGTSYFSVRKGEFSEVFNFSLSSLANLDGYGLYVTGAKKRIDIDPASFTYTLSNSGATVSTGNFDAGFSLTSLTSGTAYALTVTGLATGTSGGQYNGVLTVASVPEPESYAMLLAGLGLMGTIARRRSKSTSV